MAEKIARSDWANKFTLIGKPVINDYTFKINAKSEKSDWIYNSMNLGVNCGETHGVVYAEMMGGYSENGENRIYAFGKKEDGSVNKEDKIVIPWEDRLNDAYIEEVSNANLISVGLEKTNKDKVYREKFLSEYDAIEYIKEHLTEDMVIVVTGSLVYSIYNEVVQVRKKITNIVLAEKPEETEFKATFVQSVLIDKDSASLKNIDKDKGVMFIDVRVLDYIKEVNGVEVRGYYPYNKQFEYAMDFSNQAQCKKRMDRFFKVKSGYIKQVNFEGEFIEGGAVTKATLDDLSEDMRDLIDMGLYTEEEALAKCSSNGSRERRMVLKRPAVKNVGEDSVGVMQVFEDRYTEEDLILDCLKNAEEAPWNEESDEDGGNLDWLSSL